MIMLLLAVDMPMGMLMQSTDSEQNGKLPDFS
jgi:hypothetical protein